MRNVRIKLTSTQRDLLNATQEGRVQLSGAKVLLFADAQDRKGKAVTAQADKLADKGLLNLHRPRRVATFPAALTTFGEMTLKKVA